jgi:predicted phage terminase large subunit-like protein
MLKRNWWQFYERKDYKNGQIRFESMLMSVDSAFKDEKKNDYVAISVWGKLENRIYLVDLVNEHLNFTATVRMIRLMKARYPQITMTLVEDKANGTAVIQVLRDEIMGVIPVHPDRSKEARVQAVSFSIEAGNVYLPKDEQFTWEFIDQCASFPNGKHDDIVDSMSQALSRLIFTRQFKKEERRAKRGSFSFKLPQKKSGIGRGDKINVI